MLSKRFKKTGGLLLLSGVMALGLTGCGKKKKESAEDAFEVNLTPMTTLTEEMPALEEASVLPDHGGLVQNDLNGDWIEPEQAKKRFFAVMINNHAEAMPQSNVADADIIYELLVEGGITRLMALYSSVDGLNKIGPIRSARHYYDRATIGMDAIYIHVGQSVFAEADFRDYPLIDDINGTKDAGFFRDNSRVAPHNCYITGESIHEQMENKGYSEEKRDNAERMFFFNDVDTVPEGGQPAARITVAYNSGRKPWFEYDEDAGVYKRFQYGVPQTDEQTGEQLTFENVLIKFCPHPLVAGTDSMMDPTLVGSGKGWYASDGVIVPVTWSRPRLESNTHYYYENGEEVFLNPGKTYISVFPDTHTEDILVDAILN